MTTNKSLPLLCRAVIVACALPATILFAQSPEIPPVPAPTPGVTAVPRGPLAQIAMDDGTGITLKLRGKQSSRVLLKPGRRTTITLRYDPRYAGSTLVAAALDAGKVTFPGNGNVVTPSGLAILQFSGAERPGLYRLVINCGDTVSTLQFWVPESQNSAPDASVLVPTPGVSASHR